MPMKFRNACLRCSAPLNVPLVSIACRNGSRTILENALEAPMAFTSGSPAAAHKTFAYLEAEEQVKALRWAMRDCGRDPQPREIENTVANIRAKREAGEEAAPCIRPGLLALMRRLIDWCGKE